MNYVTQANLQGLQEGDLTANVFDFT